MFNNILERVIRSIRKEERPLDLVQQIERVFKDSSFFFSREIVAAHGTLQALEAMYGEDPKVRVLTTSLRETLRVRAIYVCSLPSGTNEQIAERHMLRALFVPNLAAA